MVQFYENNNTGPTEIKNTEYSETSGIIFHLQRVNTFVLMIILYVQCYKSMYIKNM